MIVYLTSDPGTTYIEGQTGLNKDNSFIDSLKRDLNTHIKVLIISSDPTNTKMNMENVEFIRESFGISGFIVEAVDICDDNNRDLVNELNKYDLVVLSGGHVPTQSKFFNELDLYNKIRGYRGVLMGISAGTMNLAGNVYAMPELEGESIDSEYKRFIPGLGLTDINVIPHFQYLKTVTLDGSKMIDEIAIGDSYGNEFYGIVDGAYIIIKDGISSLYGEGYLLKDG
ncbi:MAG: Type 1 glutamine amidotransferase-like domain-containing protein, partial [Candidatus Choladocola sp.]|nr:Type 1 glutamine amidotransferase-like domain-containing protein [Candidatus Choladocola sp.]